MIPQTAQTVYDAFALTAQASPDKPFLMVLPETAHKYGTSAGQFSYGEVLTQVHQWRDAYCSAGYAVGDRVALLLENRLSFFLHWFALNALGVSVVPVNADLRLAELQYLISHSEVSLVIAIESHHDLMREASTTAGMSVPVISPQELPPARRDDKRDNRKPGPDTECALLYTSGTTGQPKGCVLSNQYFLHAGQWYASTGGLAGIRMGEERMLTPLPLVHMNAMAYSVMAMVLSAGCLILLDRFHPRSWWSSVRDSGATIVHYLGVMPAILDKLPADPQDREHCVRFGFGAGVDKKLHADFEQRFGFPLLEAWAMTETGAGAVIMANREPRFVGTSCIGIEREDVRVSIVDEHGREVCAGEQGELWVCHAGANPRFGFFSHYLKDTAATEAAWQDDWFKTGDIVRRNKDGYLVFVDRKKNVIRRSGENIAAVEVEGALARHPMVQAVSVAAVPDDVRGDEVLACIVLSPAVSDRADPVALAGELVTWSLSQLAYYKVPGYVSFVNELPLTSTNKIQRGALRMLAFELISGGQAINTCHLKKPGGRT
ncbi:acyl-CoA synthetase (AMP-forming)/AMP-acid ligase II [Advenella incenata]|uniref:Acyl-CoA synthetase (AMP-forming)/AMP-acid ligase II n=1 Tax=Advenella incenata TaxID=267800 RepID=A0A4Q7VF37_9BURK|nr:AMP-binding protein [Advenella incenata]RZT94770.1 acyl-CoA synthetase (AMP-forming)/AMP-acid ligase II [Advenella incenata]